MSADPAPLRVRSRRSRGEHIVTVSGRLNGRTCAPLVEALEDALESDAVRIVLDLAELESIDHAGLDAVLAAQLRADDELKPLVIAPGPHAVQRLLDSSRGPFLYVARQDARASGRPRSRGGRPARPLQLHRARRSG
jgi:anti-anti-sigma factor